MAITAPARNVLAETLWPAAAGRARLARQATLVVLGVAALTLAAKVQVPMWPVPVTLGTLAVLSIGAAYGPRLGLATILSYMALGALGLPVFAGEGAGVSYLLGTTGGYLFGFVLATWALGAFARAGWDRSVPRMALAMLVGNALIYVPGLLWLGAVLGWDQPILAWGLWPFLIGDALKLAVAAALFPWLWRLVGDARA
jgi:biotin transport system substrate-specific component